MVSRMMQKILDRVMLTKETKNSYACEVVDVLSPPPTP